MEALNKATDILKTAILLERRGKAFYTQVARNSESKSAKRIFEMMAEEEDAHIDFLSKQFAHFEKTHEFMQLEAHQEVDDTDAVMILSEEIKKEISAAGFEAAAISAAIDFENRAIAVYSQRAEESVDENEKAMYHMLAEWEKGHHHLLHKLNEDLKEQIWNDNKFWPF
ncbi:MAG: rubrerythrin [Bacteroidetes bacterium HGW-Bacteroidetes-1]|jgi:rubrerythrin|nr:MAG: rubrerythrin [Bacteroidetes bacterium HGW-Bacteroidetes-1]